MTNHQNDQDTELTDFGSRQTGSNTSAVEPRPRPAPTGSSGTTGYSAAGPSSAEITAAGTSYAAASDLEAGPSTVNEHGDCLPTPEDGETKNSKSYLQRVIDWATDPSVDQERRHGRQAIVSVAGLGAVALPIFGLAGSLAYRGPV